MEILIIDFHISNLSPLNNGGMFRKVFLLEKVLEVIFLMTRIVFKNDLDSDAICWTCESIHKRGWIVEV